MGEWLPHDGRVLPKHANLNDKVLVRFRDGQETLAAQTVREWCGAASNWSWNRRMPGDSEIVAYKLAGER